MFKKLLAAALLCAATSSQAGYYTGNDLVLDMRHYEKAGRNDPLAELGPHGRFQGYVIGVADAYFGILVCAPPTSSRAQALAVVSQFLNANPARWAEPAADLVADALVQAFPCPKKK